MQRVILHCDMNNYFATVEEKYNPELRKIPFAVCGDPEMRHSIVLAKNELAKAAGVKTGYSFFEAKKLCPDLKFVKANYKRYLIETKTAREIFKKYTDKIIPYGLDEAWLDLTETGVTINEGEQIAELIRIEIMYSQVLSASVGVSDNLIFAKLGSDYKKPNAVTVITKENYKQVAWPLPASDLLFVGKKRYQLLRDTGIFTIGDIALSGPERIKKLFGKAGADIWSFANGDDSSFHPENDAIKSIGNTITPPCDIENAEDAAALIYLLTNSVCARLKNHNLKAHTISVVMKDSLFNSFTRQSTVSYPTDSINMIFNKANKLFNLNYSWENPLRSIGIRADNLLTLQFEQLPIIPEDDNIINSGIAERLNAVTKRFGTLDVEKNAMTKDW